MREEKLLFKTVIQPFNNKILIANKMMAKPYVKNKKSPKLPAYLSSKIGIDYHWNEKGYLVDSLGKVVPSNKNKAGMPRYWTCNNQDIYNTRIKVFQKENYMKKMEEFILPYIEDNEFIKETNMRVGLHFFIINKTENKSVDNKLLDEDNMVSIWQKEVRDVMKGLIIHDDNQTYIRGSVNDIDYVEHESETRLEITLWKR